MRRSSAETQADVMKLTITAVDTPSELDEQVPIVVDLIRQVVGSDRPTTGWANRGNRSSGSPAAADARSTRSPSLRGTSGVPS
jgi:hypothetical protein